MFANGVGQTLVGKMDLPLFAPIEPRLHLSKELVEFVQIDVR